MTKTEAIKQLREGQRLTHRYFTDDEWIKRTGEMMEMGDGAKIHHTIFWMDRQGIAWETDWDIFAENSQKTKPLNE